MNRQEKIISLVLGALLVWCFMHGSERRQDAAAGQEPAAETAKQETPDAAGEVAAPAAETPAVPEPAKEPEPPKPDEAVVEIGNGELTLSLTSWGAAAVKARLEKFPSNPGEISESNPPLEFDYSRSPLGAVSGFPGMKPDAAYEIVEKGGDYAVFENAFMKRRISVGRITKSCSRTSSRTLPPRIPKTGSRSARCTWGRRTAIRFR